MNRLRHGFAIAGLLLGTGFFVNADDFPRGFIVESLRSNPPVPAFYNLDTQQLTPLRFRQTYSRFIDFAWDRNRGRIFFSARRSVKEPFRIYMKAWPDGDEVVIYENTRGPFRFLLSPDGARLALQVMGTSVWPYIGVLAWQSHQWTALGQGYSPDWSSDGQRLLYLKIPGELPTWLYEYRVDTDSSTKLVSEPVMEAVYTDDPDQIIMKTASQAKTADWFQMWNHRNGLIHDYAKPEKTTQRRPWGQRELIAFPGHQFFLFKEAPSGANPDQQILVVTDVWGRRLQELSRDEWDPGVQTVDGVTLAMSEDPLVVRQADGTGRPVEIPQTRFIHFARE